MGVVVAQAPVGTRSPEPPQNFGHGPGPCLLVNCYLEIKFHKKNQGKPPLALPLNVFLYGKLNKELKLLGSV